MFYSKSTGGFYDGEIHGENIPSDAVEVSSEAHQTLLEGQAAGKRIVPDAQGRPTLADRLPLTSEQISAEVARARQAAYASESDPLFFKAQRGEATMEAWTAKVAEIKARFPDGVMPY